MKWQIQLRRQNKKIRLQFRQNNWRMLRTCLPLYKDSVYWWSTLHSPSSTRLNTDMTDPIFALVLRPSAANLACILLDPSFTTFSLTEGMSSRYRRRSSMTRRHPSLPFAYKRKNKLLEICRHAVTENIRSSYLESRLIKDITFAVTQTDFK